MTAQRQRSLTAAAADEAAAVPAYQAPRAVVAGMVLQLAGDGKIGPAVGDAGHAPGCADVFGCESAQSIGVAVADQRAAGAGVVDTTQVQCDQPAEAVQLRGRGDTDVAGVHIVDATEVDGGQATDLDVVVGGLCSIGGNAFQVQVAEGAPVDAEQAGVGAGAVDGEIIDGVAQAVEGTAEGARVAYRQEAGVAACDSIAEDIAAAQVPIDAAQLLQVLDHAVVPPIGAESCVLAGQGDPGAFGQGITLVRIEFDPGSLASEREAVVDTERALPGIESKAGVFPLGRQRAIDPEVPALGG
ncbi:hypothetical protein LT20_05390 [Pseudomonas aeruginosa]|nr:hypothetical protein LT20_05390 [Pseudomonas aeruginosa]